MSVGKETAQRIGYEGLTEIKEWLEATTRFNFTYLSWDSEVMCTLTCLNGETKTLDLEGHTASKPHRPVSVECKKYSTRGSQDSDFRRFLAIAYSSTAKMIADKGDWQREFMWVTFHPFAMGSWPRLLDVSFLRGCIEEFPDLLNGEKIDEELLHTMSTRTWVMVVGQKQIDLRLSKEELAVVRTALVKEGMLA